VCVIDVDECATGKACDNESSTCVNTLGSYQCRCNDGFQANGDRCEGNNPFTRRNRDLTYETS